MVRLYDAHVMHARLRPKSHRFTHAAFAFAVDLTDWSQLGQGLLLLGGKGCPYQFRDEDFLPPGPLFQPESPSASFGQSSQKLPDRIHAFCASQGHPLPANAKLSLVAMPRAFGKSYNPVVFYLITVEEELYAGIAEVHNTFGERKAWFLPPSCRQIDATGQKFLQLRTPKNFYVSPFSGLNTEFVFTLYPPTERLIMKVDHFEGGELSLISSWTGPQVPLTNLWLFWLTLKTPFLVLKVITLIHLHAAWLWLVKKLPFRRKGEDIEAQRNLRDPSPELKRSHD
jgi:DUF1365 family protein